MMAHLQEMAHQQHYFNPSSFSPAPLQSFEQQAQGQIVMGLGAAGPAHVPHIATHNGNVMLMDAAASGQGHGHNGMTEAELWLESRTATPDRDLMGDSAQRDSSLAQAMMTQVGQEFDQAMQYDGGMDSDEFSMTDGRSMTHSERTLEKWEVLLRTKPRDPMAFYWREMIQWCKNRGTAGSKEPTHPESTCGGKRSAAVAGVGGLEEGVELIDRLVKKCRCNDDPAP